MNPIGSLLHSVTTLTSPRRCGPWSTIAEQWHDQASLDDKSAHTLFLDSLQPTHKKDLRKQAAYYYSD